MQGSYDGIGQNRMLRIGDVAGKEEFCLAVAFFRHGGGAKERLHSHRDDDVRLYSFDTFACFGAHMHYCTPKKLQNKHMS